MKRNGRDTVTYTVWKYSDGAWLLTRPDEVPFRDGARMWCHLKGYDDDSAERAFHRIIEEEQANQFGRRQWRAGFVCGLTVGAWTFTAVMLALSWLAGWRP